MKKRLIDIETKIARRLLKCPGQRVFVLISEPQWYLAELPQHKILYGIQLQTTVEHKKQYVITHTNELPIAPNSIDFLILPHVMRKSYPLSELIEAFNEVLKAEGKIVFFGANDSEQYCADEIQNALKEKNFRVLSHRGYHMLPFLGESLGQLFDRYVGQFFPWMGTAYWLLAKKKMVAVTPLMVPKWKKIRKPMDSNKARPVIGRESHNYEY